MTISSLTVILNALRLKILVKEGSEEYVWEKQNKEDN